MPAHRRGRATPRDSSTSRWARASRLRRVARSGARVPWNLSETCAKNIVVREVMDLGREGGGVLAGDLRERPRSRATERSEGALLAAPPERPLSPKSTPPADPAR